MNEETIRVTKGIAGVVRNKENTITIELTKGSISKVKYLLDFFLESEFVKLLSVVRLKILSVFSKSCSGLLCFFKTSIIFDGL